VAFEKKISESDLERLIRDGKIEIVERK